MDEIIINGVDVSKCKYYSIKEYISNNNGYTEYPDYCSCYADGACFKHNNCYYKQLKLKEQECERLKNELSTYSATGICETCTEKSVLKCDQLEKENEELKQTLAEIKEIAKENIRIADLEGLNGIYRRGLATQILQKISKCEVKHG